MKNKQIQKSEEQVTFKIAYPESNMVVLTNSIGDTYTSKSESLIDFLHGAISQPKERKEYYTRFEVQELLRKQRQICAERAVVDYAERDKLALLIFAPEPEFPNKKNEITKFNPDDYIVLNPEQFPYLLKNEIAVGIRNFYLSGKPCLMEYEYEDKKYKRKCTGAMPMRLAGDICSVQIYELID
jgi:hypothetical protein